jgi:hypothetical protein
MKILDITTSRRAYMLYNNIKPHDDYKFFLSNQYDENDLRTNFPKCLDNLIDKNNLDQFKDFDACIFHTCSILYRKYDKKIESFVNSFGGKIFAVDYAWECSRRRRRHTNKRFKRNISGLGVAISKNETKVPFFPYSQPDLDIFAQVEKFRTRKEIAKCYNIPDGFKYLLITVQKMSFVDKKMKLFCKFLRTLDDVFLIWKIKEKHSKQAKMLSKYMKQFGLNEYIIIIRQPKEILKKTSQPEGKNFRSFISPMCDLSVISDVHINLSPLSYTQVETIRAGIPTYYFTKRGFSRVDDVEDIKKHMWKEEAVEKYFSFRLNKRESNLKVKDNFCTMQFLKNIAKSIGDTIQ